MNSIFSFKRFGLLLKNHLIESRKKYTLFTVSLLAIGLLVLILFFIFNNYNDYNCYCEIKNTKEIDYINQNRDWQMFQMVLYWAGLFGFGSLFALASYINFGNQGEAIFYMNKPASIFEKWLVESFVRIILYFVVYTIIYLILFIPASAIIHSYELAAYTSHYKFFPYSLATKQDYCQDGIKPIFEYSPQYYPFSQFSDIKESNFIYSALVSGFVSIVAFFMYGSVLFNRFSFFKTFLLGFGVFMIYVFYAYIINLDNNNLFIASGWDHDLFETHATNLDNRDLFVTMDATYFVKVYYIFIAIVPFCLLAVSYFKLKEKEV